MQGKVIRHRCGYPLRVAQCGFVTEDAVVVGYREVAQFSLLLYHCPGCGEELQLWWVAPPALVAAQRVQWQRELATLLGYEEG